MTDRLTFDPKLVGFTLEKSDETIRKIEAIQADARQSAVAKRDFVFASRLTDEELVTRAQKVAP